MESINCPKIFVLPSSNLIILFIVVIQSAVSWNMSAQTSKAYYYKHSRIYVDSNQIMPAKKIVLKEGFVKYPITDNAGATSYRAISLDAVSKIEASFENHAILGTFIGTGIGVGAMFIVKDQVEKPKVSTSTSTSTMNGVTKTTTITTTEKKSMAGIEKALIVGAGSFVGLIVGSAIKTGWDEVYPNNKSPLKNISLNVYSDFRHAHIAGLKLTF